MKEEKLGLERQENEQKKRRAEKVRLAIMEYYHTKKSPVYNIRRFKPGTFLSMRTPARSKSSRMDGD